MAKQLKSAEIGKPKTLTLRLDSEAATRLDHLISKSRESTYASLITSMIMDWQGLVATAQLAQSQAQKDRAELDEFKRQVVELKGVMEFMLNKLNSYDTIAQRAPSYT